MTWFRRAALPLLVLLILSYPIIRLADALVAQPERDPWALIALAVIAALVAVVVFLRARQFEFSWGKAKVRAGECRVEPAGEGDRAPD